MRSRLIILCALCGMLTACHRTQPQVPSQRNGAVVTTKQDSAIIALVELNQRLSEEADKVLAGMADSTMVMEESGYWVKGLHDVESGLKEGEQRQIGMRIFDLDSVLLGDIEENIVVGKYETLQAVADVLGMVHEGDSIEMLVPWYLGYGVTGSQWVKPYTNLRIELKIK